MIDALFAFAPPLVGIGLAIVAVLLANTSDFIKRWIVILLALPVVIAGQVVTARILSPFVIEGSGGLLSGAVLAISFMSIFIYYPVALIRFFIEIVRRKKQQQEPEA